MGCGGSLWTIAAYGIDKVSLLLSKGYINSRQSKQTKNNDDMKYLLYHDSFSSCASEARNVAQGQGYEINEDSWADEVTFNGPYTRARPDVGQAHRFTVSLLRNGKEHRKALHFQVFGMATCFELNAYVS